MDIESAIRTGLNTSNQGRVGGACRVYVCLDKVDRKTLNAYKKAAGACGLRYLKEAYGSGSRVLYIGYDNFTGRIVAQGQAIAEELQKLGLPAWFDAVGD